MFMKDWSSFVLKKIRKCPLDNIAFTKQHENLEFLEERNNSTLVDLTKELKATKFLVFAEKQKVQHKNLMETRFRCYYIYTKSKGRCFLIVVGETIKIVTAFPLGRTTLNQYRKRKKHLNKYL